MKHFDDPMRIAYVVGKMENGGVESVIMDLLRRIPSDTIRIDLFFDQNSSLPQKSELAELGIACYPVPAYARPISYLRTLQTLFEKNQYDIVHAHMSTVSWLPLLAAKRAGVGIRICHNHTTSHPEEKVKSLMKRLFRPLSLAAATQWFACGEEAADWMYGKKDKRKKSVVIVNNAISLDPYRFDGNQRNMLRGAFQIEEDTLIIGHIGRFSYAKNHAFLLSVFSELRRINPRAILMMAGEGKLLDDMKKQAEQSGLADATLFLGARSDASSLYSMFDVFCLPSFYEGMPVVLVEAAANGLPVVCSTEVTGEVACFPRLQRMELKEGAEAWAKMLLESASIGRTDERLPDCFEELYNADLQSERLRSLYRDLALQRISTSRTD